MATLLKRKHRQQIEKQISWVIDGVDSFIGNVYKRLSHAPRLLNKYINGRTRMHRRRHK